MVPPCLSSLVLFRRSFSSASSVIVSTVLLLALILQSSPSTHVPSVISPANLISATFYVVTTSVPLRFAQVSSPRLTLKNIWLSSLESSTSQFLMHQTKPVVFLIKLVNSLVFSTPFVTAVHPHVVRYHVALLLVSGCFQSTNSSLLFPSPPTSTALIFTLPLQPNWSPCRYSALSESIPRESHASETQL